MGEIADAMLDGVLCQCCGTYLDDGPGPGYPVTCHACGGDDLPERPARRRGAKKHRASRLPLEQRPMSPFTIAARIQADQVVTPAELRALAQHVLQGLGAERLADLRRAFPPVPFNAQEPPHAA